MTKEETAFRKRLEALPKMTNREAMEIVLKLAEFGDSIAQAKGLEGKRLTDKEREQYPEAIYQMQDYMNDLMREEPATGCDYGIGG